MRPVAADIARSMVCVSVCLSIGCLHDFLCKKGWTDRDAVSGADSFRSKKPCITWGSRSPRKGTILGLSGPLKDVIMYYEHDLVRHLRHATQTLQRFADLTSLVRVIIDEFEQQCCHIDCYQLLECKRTFSQQCERSPVECATGKCRVHENWKMSSYWS